MTSLPPNDYAKAHAAAAAMNMSVSGYLAALVARDHVDSEGRPLWAETSGQEELLLAM